MTSIRWTFAVLAIFAAGCSGSDSNKGAVNPNGAAGAGGGVNAAAGRSSTAGVSGGGSVGAGGLSNGGANGGLAGAAGSSADGGGGGGSIAPSAGGAAGMTNGSGGVLGAAGSGGNGGKPATSTAGTSGTAGVSGSAGAGGSSTATGGASGASGTACVPGTSGWAYVVSCDFTVAGIVHQCIDYYGTALSKMAVDISSRGTCSAMTGTVMTTPCTGASSVGSCITVASTGAVVTSSQAEYARQYSYASTGVTADTARAACATPGSTFAPAGSAATVGVPTLTCPSGGSIGSSGAGQLAFAVATVLNGEVIQCTNYVGAATEAQRQSIVAIGGMLTPCPTQNAICACAQAAGSGTFSTNATAISYTTSFAPQTGCGSSPAAGCSTTYTPPPVP